MLDNSATDCEYRWTATSCCQKKDGLQTAIIPAWRTCLLNLVNFSLQTAKTEPEFYPPTLGRHHAGIATHSSICLWIRSQYSHFQHLKKTFLF